MENTKGTPIERLQKELESGIQTYKNLVERKADKEMLGYQVKIINGSLDALIKTITGEIVSED